MNTNNELKKITYLNIPYKERNEAKQLAGKLPSGEYALGFDPKLKLWYAKEGVDITKLSKWIPDANKGISINDGNTDPIAEFAETLKGAGFILKGLPVMDGSKQRVKTIEDKEGQMSGVYVGFLDQAKPAGWYVDFRKSEDIVKWVATGKALDKEAQSHQLAIIAQRKLERDIKQEALFNHTSKRVTQLYNLLPDATLDHPYLQKKQITSSEALKGVKLDKKNRLVMPIRSAEGKIMSIQRIDANGNKRIKKNSQKMGNFFVVGGNLPEPLDKESLIYAEGFSTAASISQSLGKPVIMAIDAGNLPNVIKNLTATHWKSEHLIFSDDDIKREGNKGQAKANEAVNYVNSNNFGKAINVKPLFSEKELEQGNTDFNDLYILRGSVAIQEHYKQAIQELHNPSINNEQTKTYEVMNEIEKANIEEELEI